MTALLAIGFGVYGSLERNVRFTSRQYVDGALLLFFKIGALAFVTNRTVNLFSENKVRFLVPSLPFSLSSFLDELTHPHT